MAAQQFADFAELSLRLKDVRFTLICCPSTQFLNQESPAAEDVQGFVLRKLGPSGGSFIVTEKVDVNGGKTHPLFYYLKRHSCLYEERSNSAMPIPWNYGKFLVGLDGQVVGYKGPKSSPLDFEPEIRALLGQQ